MKTEVLREHDIARAAEILRSGGNVIFPTETVYGLGASIYSQAALENIFRAKGRPQDNPLIVHVADRSLLASIWQEVTADAIKLMDAFWPGPLTIVLKKHPKLSSTVTAGLETVGVRMPSNPIALKLLRLASVPVAAPSANPSGFPSPTREEHTKEMLGRVEAILLGGDCEVGLESSVVDLSTTPPRLLRPGKVSLQELKKILPDLVLYEGAEKTASPGRMYRHYAPKTPVFLLKGSPQKRLEFLRNHPHSGFLCDDFMYTEDKRLVRFLPGGSLEEASRMYYDALRTLDNQGFDAIYIPEVEAGGMGAALRDRMLRSSEGRTIDLGGEDETDHRK